jgi:hypothetical protein
MKEKDAARIVAQPLPDLVLHDASILKRARDAGSSEA